MKKTIILILCVVFTLSITAFAQTDFKYENLYQTVYPSALCDFLKANPKARLIDVRSPGEFADTSANSNLNIGHLKGAINISIDSIAKNLDKLKAFSNEPIVLYCSHSQRSRRVSKTLIENGFTQVYNLNGGMSVLNQSVDFPCKNEMIVSELPYQNLSVQKSIDLIKSTKDLVILDVRSKTEFEGKDSIEGLNVGSIKNAINIPAKEIENSLKNLDKNKAILVYDNRGIASNPVAKYLVENGFTKVYHLLGGLSALIGKDRETQQMRKEFLVNVPSYNMLNLTETYNFLEQKSNIVILDIRPTLEYTNKATLKYRNLGHLKNAIHIEPKDFNATALVNYKNAPVLVYGSDNPAQYAKALKQAGFENVNLLYGSLFDLVSATFNMQNLKGLSSFLVDHDGLY